MTSARAILAGVARGARGAYTVCGGAAPAGPVRVCTAVTAFNADVVRIGDLGDAIKVAPTGSLAVRRTELASRALSAHSAACVSIAVATTAARRNKLARATVEAAGPKLKVGRGSEVGLSSWHDEKVVRDVGAQNMITKTHLAHCRFVM